MVQEYSTQKLFSYKYLSILENVIIDILEIFQN